jgi:hypothetical protein
LRRICGLGVVVLALAVSATPGRDTNPGSREKGMDDKEVVGKVKEVDAKKKSFVVTLEDKSDRPFLVNKETKFTGPRGADREEGLTDPCMAAGYEVHVVPDADAKFAKEVKLSAWKGDAKKKKG